MSEMLHYLYLFKYQHFSIQLHFNHKPNANIYIEYNKYKVTFIMGMKGTMRILLPSYQQMTGINLKEVAEDTNIIHTVFVTNFVY